MRGYLTLPKVHKWPPIWVALHTLGRVLGRVRLRLCTRTYVDGDSHAATGWACRVATVGGFVYCHPFCRTPVNSKLRAK
ncbi:hypothetical protein GGR53DRAFT_473894 [Hypoxylon sp. FL1150]|nr:hypothetical protein GGR53DRAFT_473894 [Hypoxylon sp. FL1150]